MKRIINAQLAKFIDLSPNICDPFVETTNLSSEIMIDEADQKDNGKSRNSKRHNRKKHRECRLLAKCEKVIQSKLNSNQQSNLDAMIFNEMCDEADIVRDNETKRELAKEGCRKVKRCLKLLRGFDKDLKLDIAAAQLDRNDEAMPPTPNNIKIETRNRFRSLCSKPVDVEEKFNESQGKELLSVTETEPIVHSPRTQSLKERELFHDTFSFLIKLGSTDKERNNCNRQMSREETRWQNELKDLIWLELQANKADRSPLAQDEFLCKQREAVGPLLREILEYRYSGVGNLNSCGSSSTNDVESIKFSSPNCTENTICYGCLSMYCRTCVRTQIDALKQVEVLLARLEAAETLFPSSQAFASQYPLSKSLEFTGRVKAMCLWYNMTRQHRLKLLILGKLLMLLHTKKKHDDNTDSGFGSHNTNSDHSMEQRPSLVRFEVPDDNTSPSDSNNSNASHSSSISGVSFGRTYSSSSESAFSYTEDEKLERLDFYLMEFDRQAYRKYIEDVLKTKGLRKSLNFLERLHTTLLRKARLSLEKHQEDCDSSGTEEFEGDDELRRYGAWSPEAKEINLPSYRAAFLFLSRVPLDVIHEFMMMRLEQKPEQPSPLSVRQLMRELREGLRIACLHRDRFAKHSLVAMACDKKNSDAFFQQELKEFDTSLKAVFEVYLDYLKQWVEMVNHDSFHKNLIMKEWNFVKSIAPDIVDGYSIAGKKFCEIVQMMIRQVIQFLTERPEELNESEVSKEDEEWSTRFHWMSVGREWQGMFVKAQNNVVKSVNLAKCVRNEIENWPEFNDDLKHCIVSLKDGVLNLRRQIVLVIQEFQNKIDKVKEPIEVIEVDCLAFRTRVREILHQAYRMGFEYHKELCRLFLSQERELLVHDLVDFAFLWMNFVRNRCERGRGLRPRWANQGLDYLMTVCEPLNTKYLTDDEFEELKSCMDRCISHVIGSASSPGINSEGEGLKKLSHSRASSPSQGRNRASSFNQKNKDFLKSPEVLGLIKKSPSQTAVDGSATTSENTFTRQERVLQAVQKLEVLINEKLKSLELIGQVTDRKSVDKIHIKAKRVTFTWQRGIKIGQGRFGKVYTVVNNQTGELLAMKELQLQPGDHRAIKRIAEELKIFEGIQHQHLVRYYGLEVHREEMLIFMEFCAEGTLESLVAGSEIGLPETLVRKYTNQMLLAVAVLHAHGIVHRDIKTANIFLTNEGDCLKLGDFGCAVQIKAHTTMPGELQGFVGTQAYMAPEIFMKNESSGHGRAADIWSVGCCVVEMSSGRRPWSEFDSNYQIMFKVGMGESPALPKSLSQEGIDFIQKCLQHDSRKRPTANSLLSHSFARAYDDVNAD
ncbi:mitogen-activated protein kinase kinase kinase 4 [Leptopilina heterotoma]|uniref:mitogen-activated protein kinase kinase kinase 4 n=1 Tax=Leptopilina heterotoma TaxID=63436 RepID=UPI001CA96B8A|nr:mitogen-activated protein kinase kinase kinase 4 [Leptopilina heterotoma]